MKTLVSIAEAIRRALERVAFASGWLLVIMATVTTFDVITRKIGLNVHATKLQELEWHFHAAIFAMWMGYCYTINAHPRVDSFTEHMGLRRKAWLEFAGCLLLALPYVTIVSWYSIDYVYNSWKVGEISNSTVGLTHRWIIKGIFALGLWMVVVAILSVLLRLIAFLFGGRPQEEVELQIGHTVAEV